MSSADKLYSSKKYKSLKFNSKKWKLGETARNKY